MNTQPQLSWLFAELQQQMGVNYTTIRLTGALYERARMYAAAYLAECLSWHDEDIMLIVGMVATGHDERYYADPSYQQGYDRLLSALSGYKYSPAQPPAFVAAHRPSECSVINNGCV